jgi:lipooligosaccharide transport system permease protein
MDKDLPSPSALASWIPVWRRNALVWKKMALASMLGQLGEPFLYLFALGFGLGGLIGELDGIPYVLFLASGVVCSSAMFTGAFEATYSAYTRMVSQGTWRAMLSTPLTVRDIVVGEAMWAASKGLLSGCAMMLVAAGLGVITQWQAVLAIPVAALVALCFASLGLMVTAVARSYDAFLFFTTLVITPMLLLGGVFFPLSRMPEMVQMAAAALPLTQGVKLARALVTGQPPDNPIAGVAIILGVTIIALSIAVRLTRKRMTH